MQTIRLLAIVLVAGLLSACSTSLIDSAKELGRKGNDYAAKGLVELLAAECARDTVQRKDLLTKVNAEAAGKQMKHRAVPMDCDGDGTPDVLE